MEKRDGKTPLRIRAAWAAVPVIFVAALSTVALWGFEHYAAVSVILLLGACAPFFVRFELVRKKPEELVLIGLMASMAAVSRIPFAALPGVQPTTFFCVLTGAVMGPEAGFMTGATAALVSNMALGQGPWTPWQMLGWGLAGFLAGLLRRTFVMKSWAGRLVFGFLWGFVYGWIQNIWWPLLMGEGLTLPALIAACVVSAQMDLYHALSNAFFLTSFYAPFFRELSRIRGKYGLLEKV